MKLKLMDIKVIEDYIFILLKLGSL
ncbi:hypothetical protein LXL04_026758 [Taraxacum kok-saghyz]